MTRTRTSVPVVLALVLGLAAGLATARSVTTASAASLRLDGGVLQTWELPGPTVAPDSPPEVAPRSPGSPG